MQIVLVGKLGNTICSSGDFKYLLLLFLRCLEIYGVKGIGEILLRRQVVSK